MDLSPGNGHGSGASGAAAAPRGVTGKCIKQNAMAESLTVLEQHRGIYARLGCLGPDRGAARAARALNCDDPDEDDDILDSPSRHKIRLVNTKTQPMELQVRALVHACHLPWLWQSCAQQARSVRHCPVTSGTSGIYDAVVAGILHCTVCMQQQRVAHPCCGCVDVGALIDRALSHCLVVILSGRMSTNCHAKGTGRAYIRCSTSPSSITALSLAQPLTSYSSYRWRMLWFVRQQSLPGYLVKEGCRSTPLEVNTRGRGDMGIPMPAILTLPSSSAILTLLSSSAIVTRVSAAGAVL